LEAGYDVVVVDNLSNSCTEALDRVSRIAGRPVSAFYRVDVRDRESMRAVFAQHRIDSVIHFAALKAVGESVTDPLRYYDNNIVGTIALAEVMAERGVNRL
ncbi:GDP-mannose 4,6-dehydratase, partial [Arthrospira platensis SPKY1]|nr:GDP-mannose 4,6-dehydratase [Arthrospira platensis SPKY1]